MLQSYETGVTWEKVTISNKKQSNEKKKQQQQQPANKWSLETAKFLFWSPNEVKRKFWKTASSRSLLTVAPFPKTKSILFEGRGRGACTQARTWGFLVLRCSLLFLCARLQWIKSHLTVLRWSYTVRCAVFPFLNLRYSVKRNNLRTLCGVVVYHLPLVTRTRNQAKRAKMT